VGASTARMGPCRAGSAVATLIGRNRAHKPEAQAKGIRNMHIIQCPPHELPGLVRCVWRLREGCFWLECWTTPKTPPDPQYREPMPEDLVSQRCA